MIVRRTGRSKGGADALRGSADLAPPILWGQGRREVVPMGAAAPTDGKRVLSAAGSPEGSRPFGKVARKGGGRFRKICRTLYDAADGG